MLKFMAVIMMILALFCIRSVSGRFGKEWGTINYDQLEADWSKDDADQDKLSDGDILQKQILERKQTSGYSSGMTGDSDPHGPQMLFVQLRQSTTWTKEKVNNLASLWKEMLFTGGIEVNCYQIEDTKMLVALQKGWQASQVKDFLMQQVKEIKEIEWQKKTYFPEQDRDL